MLLRNCGTLGKATFLTMLECLDLYDGADATSLSGLFYGLKMTLHERCLGAGLAHNGPPGDVNACTPLKLFPLLLLSPPPGARRGLITPCPHAEG